MGKKKNNNQNGQNGQNGPHKEIVMKVYMHCEGCASDVHHCLKGFDGVEQVKTEIEENKVIVLGKFEDPMKILTRVKTKFSKTAELISPNIEPNKEESKEPPKKEEEEVKIAVLKMYMHCDGCVSDIKRVLLKMTGVYTVEADMEKSTVEVRGLIDPPKLVEAVTKRMGKHAELLSQRSENNKKENNNNNNNNKKKHNGANNNNNNNNKQNVFSYPPQYSVQHAYPCQLFSDENVNSCSIM